MDKRRLPIDMGQSWVPPAGLERSRPRLVRLTASGKFLVVVSIALGLGALAAGAGLSALAARQGEEARLLQKAGMVTGGRVTRLWRSGDKNNQPWVAYQFFVAEGIYSRNARLPVRAWRNLRVGSYLPVRYVSSRPEINHPDGYASGPLPPWVPVLVAVALAAMSYLATLPIRSQSRLLSSGRAAPGLVTGHGRTVRTTHGANLGQQYFYKFQLLSGASSRGRGGPSKIPPSVGSTITVLYDPDNPGKNAPFPLSMVRLPDTSTR